jgi:serine-type D-Ala-D-Ala carboxypeptidase
VIHHPLDYIDTLLRTHIIDAGVAPGAAACVAVRHSQQWLAYEGVAGRVSPDSPVSIRSETLFDLASVTKSIVAFSTARAVDAGYLQFATQVGELLPWSLGTPSARLNVELLLSHRAGFEAHRELFGDVLQGKPFEAEKLLREAAWAIREDARGAIPAEGFAPLYSDLGYLLLGLGLEATTRQDLDRWIAEVLARVGIGGLSSARLSDASAHAAATEDVPLRGGLVQGVVHDENAWAVSGARCSGHAGLFGSALSVAQFGCLMVDLARGRSSALSPHATETLLKPRPGASLRAGFDGKSDASSSVGSVLGPRTFGHLGFTGTSFWCDPDLEVVVVCLTNRVCPSRENLKIRAARPVVHDALAKFALERRDATAAPNP